MGRGRLAQVLFERSPVVADRSAVQRLDAGGRGRQAGPDLLAEVRWKWISDRARAWRRRSGDRGRGRATVVGSSAGGWLDR